MKKLHGIAFILFNVLFYSWLFYGCEHFTTFNVGECFGADSATEKWEDPGPIWKIVAIGSTKVEVRMYEHGRWYEGTGSYHKWALHMDKQITCPAD